MKDQLFADSQKVRPFRFTGEVSNVFDDMIKRSVPGYITSLEMIAAITSQLCKNTPWAGCDLGCALGESSLALTTGMQNKPGIVYAVDNSRPMLNKLQQKLTSLNEKRIQPVLHNIEDYSLPRCDIIVLHFTLQFISQQHRAKVLKKCREALNPGGGILLFEKVSDTKLTEQTHKNFKSLNGYSELEIARKRQALEDVLITESEEVHVNRLYECGFTEVKRIFQALNFYGWLGKL